MKVFISWSGDRSRQAAEILRAWLPRVIQSVQPWMSQEDISAGSRWLSEVSSVLDSTQIGILCVMPENQHNPWLLFEAGALSKSLRQGRVCPLLFEMTAGQLSGPLTQFQAHTFGKEGVLRILSVLNEEAGDRALPEGEVEQILEVWWPHLNERISSIPPPLAPAEARSVQGQLDELLSLARENLRRENLRLEAFKYKDEKMEKLLGMIDDSFGFMSSMDSSAKKIQGSVKDAFGAIIQKIDKNQISSSEAVKEMLEATFFSNHQIPQVDISSLREMREIMEEFEDDHRRHIERLINPPDSSA